MPVTGSIAELTQSLDALLRSCQQKADQAEQWADIAQTSLTPDSPELQRLASVLAEADRLLCEAESATEREEGELEQLQASVLPGLRGFNAELKQLKEQQENEMQEREIVRGTPAAGTPRQPLSNVTNAANLPSDPSLKKKPSSRRDKDTAGSARLGARMAPDRIAMAHVTNEEFDTIPKYMRGRLELSRLNAAVDAWLALLREKYSLLHKAETNFRALSEAQARRVQQWSDEETDETRDCFFLSADDLRQCAPLQSMGSINLKAVLVGLRHVGRVRNSTGAGPPKYLLVQ